MSGTRFAGDGGYSDSTEPDTTSPPEPSPGGGRLIVLTASLTEAIDHAGYFIQMSMASLPAWLEWIMNKRYPRWREVERNDDGSAGCMPAGVRLLEASLLRHYRPEDIVACYPDDMDRFIGPNTRVVAVSTHNPLGVTFAAGVYASLFGSSRQPINSRRWLQLDSRGIRNCPTFSFAPAFRAAQTCNVQNMKKVA